MIFRLLKSGATLTVYKELARAIGLEASLMYSELLKRWERFAELDQLTEDGYFYNTIEDMQRETFLSAHQQRAAIKLLTELNLIQTTVKGLPAKRFFLVNPDSSVIESILKKECEEQPAQQVQESQKQVVKNLITDSDAGSQPPEGANLTYSRQLLKIQQQEVKILTQYKHKNKDQEPKEQNLKESSKDTSPSEKAQAPSIQKQKPLFALPEVPLSVPHSGKNLTQAQQSENKIFQARHTGDWDKVTNQDFAHYYVQAHNKIMSKPVTFDRYTSTTIIRDNLIGAFDIDKSKVCEYIDQLLLTYSKSPDKYDWLSFNMIQKASPLMKDLMRQVCSLLEPVERTIAYNDFTDVADEVEKLKKLSTDELIF
jgi:hypothetical protein